MGEREKTRKKKKNAKKLLMSECQTREKRHSIPHWRIEIARKWWKKQIKDK